MVNVSESCADCCCSKCLSLSKCRIISSSTKHFCEVECNGKMGVGNCPYIHEEEDE